MCVAKKESKVERKMRVNFCSEKKEKMIIRRFFHYLLYLVC